jgi:tetratricopeptide (TPR) repeat protein
MSERGGRQTHRELLVSLSLMLITLLTFSNLFRKDYEFFNIDDDEYVTENPHVQSGLTWEELGWALTAFHSNNWHPLTWASLQLDYQLYGARPWGFRLTNVLLHAASAVLLFWALRRMSGALWPSAAVAGLFALHPLHVESVAWVSERKDVLGACFWMLTLGAYAYYAERPSPWRYTLVIALFALGLMAKPMLVTLPFVLLLLDFWPLGRFGGTAPIRLILEKLPLLALAGVSCALTLQAQHNLMHPLELFPLESRVVNALVSYVTYIGQMVWPANLIPFYPHPEHDWSLWQGVAAGVVLAALTLLAWRYRRPAPYGLVGWLWYLGTLVPVIGLVQVGMQARADRYTYLPLIGLFIILAWGLPELLARWHAPKAVSPWLAAGVLTACAACTWQQTRYWQSSLTLWRHAADVTPGNKVAHNNLGVSLLKKGETDRAVSAFERVLQIDPRYDIAALNLSTALRRRGKQAEAAAVLTRIIDYHPENEVLRCELGEVLLHLPGKQEEAAGHFRAALAANPRFWKARGGLGMALLISGEVEGAIAELTEAVRNAPQLIPAQISLGLAHLLQGDPSQALPCFDEALRFDPRHVDASYDRAYALRLLARPEAEQQYARARRLDPGWPDTAGQEAWGWATSADPRARNGRLALLRAQMACIAQPQHPRLMGTLAAAYAELGRFEEALATAREARALASRTGQAGLAAALEMHLRLYQDHKPFRPRSPGPRAG